MSAVKIIFKRSSLLGKRPTGANLEAGEIGLNTNSNDPGLFFEVNDGSVVKAGPTAYLPEAPTQTPALGELWVDKDTKALSIGNGEGDWQKVASPFLGGTNGLTVFVAPEYQNATDSLSNDGQTVPFVTINRAILEVTKNIIQQRLNGLSEGNNRYLIVLAPGRHCVVNSPSISSNGVPNLSNPFTEVTQDILAQFNPSEVGGLILPRGVSLVGLDLKKCEVHPTYVPTYTHPSFPPGYQQVAGGPVFENQPASSLFKWSGNTYVTNFTGLDKIDYRLVTQVAQQTDTNYAIFQTQRPHGLGFNDFVRVQYTDKAQQLSVPTFVNGEYYAYPITSYQFLLSPTSWSSTDGPQPISFASLPSSFREGNSVTPKLDIWNIYPYFVPYTDPLTNVVYPYELHSYSHHRLSIIKNASVRQLNDFYVKVQQAFPEFFGGQVNTNLVSAPEFDIVAPTTGTYPNNLQSNSTDFSSPYQNMVNHRSDYGMANGDYDGNVVSGFKSVIINSATAVILQKDPAAYELYAEKTSQNWLPLTQYTKANVDQFTTFPITSIPTVNQLAELNAAYIPNIRYYYTTLTVTDPKTGLLKSTGVPNPDNDFRHFGFRVSGPNSYMQAQSVYTIGAAIACWAKNGSIISLTNATTNFGSVAFEAEGFAGIGTLGGANEINKGFQLQGTLCPLALTAEAVESDQQKRILSLGSKVMNVGLDPQNPLVQQIYLQRDFEPATILPFSLKPGSAVFVNDGVCTYRAFFVTDGSQTCIPRGDLTQNPHSEGGAVLRVRFSDSTIPNGITTLEIPYIRRFIDPRTDSERSYGFYIQNTNPFSQAPQLGSVLRLNQNAQLLANSFKRNVQFDPGQYGGIAQVFTVDAVETALYSFSTNFNYKIADASQDTNYVIYASLTDASTPWVQSVPSNPQVLDSSLVPFYNPQGSYITYGYRNFYSVENNLWTSLYYGNKTTFTETNGPTKVTPTETDSPFVLTSVLERNEPVTDSWQGSVPDPYYDYYVEGVPVPYRDSLSYMRGAVIPYTELGPQFQVDEDDSSKDLGIIPKITPLPTDTTVLVAPTAVYQTPQAMTSPFVTNRTFGRPEIVDLELLAVQQIVQPKEGVSILELSYPQAGPNDHPELRGVVEYVRVVGLISNVAQAIRNYYPQYAELGDLEKLPDNWPAKTRVRVCISNGIPESSVYDPDWAVTKATMFRFYELMGYPRSKMATFLKPGTAGQRLFLNEDIPYTPDPEKGYANLTTAWPVEFNNPSAIIANTHTWQYVGYFDYSRGLPKYQVNQIPRKLSYDFLSTTSWGGRLTVMGADETGQLVFLGPIKEALTGQYYLTESPLSYATDRQIYKSPDPVLLPNPVLVYSVDDISGQFDGSSRTFDLKRGGYSVPTSQLSTYGVFVFLGGVVQEPNVAYTVQGSSFGLLNPQIVFTEAPLEGTSCDIRIVTSDDEDESIEVVSYNLGPSFDGSRSNFTISPSDPTLTNLNSFVFLGGVEQNPSGPPVQADSAYSIQYSGGVSTIVFDGSPLDGTVLDMRGILPGSRYRNAGVSTVFVSSVDDISDSFDGLQQTFPLLIGGKSLDPTKVNAQNMFVSLGGVMQIPIAQEGDVKAGETYRIQIDPSTSNLTITFSTPPATFTTCNIRVVTSEEILTCPLPASLFDTTLQDGPGIVVNDQNQIVKIDPGLIQP